ncbi:MAG: hypothetical protein WC997_11615 [Porticoccaceae bacterium]
MTETDAVDVWKHRIEAGNRAFRKNDFKEAVICYQKACARAQSLLEFSADYRGAVAALLVSYHNLADTLILEEQETKALGRLRDVHWVLMMKLNRSGIPPAQHWALLDGCHRNRVQICLTVRTLHERSASKASVPLAPVIALRRAHVGEGLLSRL